MIRVRREQALLCVFSMHHDTWLKVVNETLTPLVRSLKSNEEIDRAIDLIYAHSALADALEEDQLLRLEGFVRAMPTDKLLLAENLLNSRKGLLYQAARARVERVKAEEISACHRPAYWSQAVIGMSEPVVDRRNGARA